MIEYSFSIAELEFFLMVLTRITCFIFIAPFFNMNNTPAVSKIGIGFFLTLLIYPMLYSSTEMVVYNTVFGYVAIILKEAMTGLLIGLSANICTMIVSFAGRIIDMEIGLSMVSLMDPTTREQGSFTGVYYQYMMMLMFIITGLYQYLIRALLESFTLIPVNGAVFHSDKLLNAILSFLSEYMMIGFRICLPIFAVILLLNAILGIMAKVSPQMNMFAVGIQLKVFVGLIALYLTATMLPSVLDNILNIMRRTIVSFVEAIM
ncbi:MAG: flagellar biosynthetic protein FliR [Lachnospiraceae bacterium]